MSARPRVLRHYEVGEEIGAGGMGRVCVGTDVRDGSPVAIKFLQPSLAQADPSFLDRFEHEAHVAALLRSPYTVHLLDYGESDGAPCIVMEFVEGKSAGALLREGPLRPQQAARIARDAARALAEARARGVVHRDIKPENILVTPAGMARVADFGIARQEAADGLTAPGGYLGTVAYSAPEQLLGEAEHRSDLFALGATLYAMLTGRTPFGPGGARAFAAGRSLMVDYSGVPEPLANVIRRCLERDPRDRYQSADDLAGALERAIKLLPVPVESIDTLAATLAATDRDSATGDTPIDIGHTAPPAEAAASGTLTALAPGRTPEPGAVELASAETVIPRPARASPPVRGTPRRRGVLVGAIGLLVLAVVAVVIWVGVRGSGGGKKVNAAAAAHQTATVATGAAGAASTRTALASPSVVGAIASAPASATAFTAVTAVSSPQATPTPNPAPTPTAAPPPPTASAEYISSGEWDYNFTVISATDACAGDPAVGAVLTYSYTYAETGSVATGQIHDGDAAHVTEIGGPVVGDITFHWPTLDFDYPITNGHASITNQFSTPGSGTATLTETYDDGCVVVMQDNS